MDLNTMYHRTVECWADRVNDVDPDRWDAPTPCPEWTVRDLVNHVAGEDLWTVPLMEGSTIADVGDRFDGDVLGDDPIGSALAAASRATEVVARRLPAAEPVHLSYGEDTSAEYVHQLAADHLVHSWDLAVATGTDSRLDPHLVAEVAAWFADREELYRGAGIVGPHLGFSGDPQANLLAAFGRDPSWGPAHAALARFSAAFGRGDIDAIMSLMTEDCVFEATGPAPDGVRHEGADAVRLVWEELFAGTSSPRFTAEESFVAGDRGVLRWRFDWLDDDGTPGHVRGVDVLRLRDGLVAEKLSYVKG
ncbi:MAG TPA: TIGR03086 family metal-binding protein [Marmoricola sp.]|nr:TIGR03086 family metal-binding protein [Marmoricola sp.]